MEEGGGRTKGEGRVGGGAQGVAEQNRAEVFVVEPSERERDIASSSCWEGGGEQWGAGGVSP